MATYYVKTGGNDSAAGTSDGTAWAHCPGMAAWAGSASLAPGDTVYFREGDVFEGADSDGTVAVLEAAAGVTYLGLGYGTAGTRAELKSVSTSTVQSYVGSLNINASNVTVKHFNINANEKYIGGVYIGLYHDGNVDNVTVEDCIVHDVGNSAFTNTQAPIVYEYGVIVGQNQHHTTSNINLINNEIYNTAHEGISIYPSAYSTDHIATNILVRGNVIHDTAHWGATSWGKAIGVADYSTNVTIEYNYIYSIPSAAGVVISTFTNSFRPDNVVIRYNILNGCSITQGATNNSEATWGTHYIYSNIIMDGHIYLSGDFKSSAQYVYNNTVRNTLSGGDAFWIYYTSTNTSNIEVKNNIFMVTHASAKYCYEDNSALVSKHSNNLCYRSTSGNWVRYNGSFYSGADIRTWEATSQYTDPSFTGGTLPTGFTGTYGTDMAPNQTYFRITSGDALGNGTVLSSPYNKAINNAGTNSTQTRGAAFDIGAYEYTLEDPSAPAAAKRSIFRIGGRNRIYYTP